MRRWLILFLVQFHFSLSAQLTFNSAGLCEQLDELVNEVIPESFEDISFEETTISEVEDDQEYKKMDYPYLGADYVYFTEDGELNKKLLCYPLVTSDRDEALNFYVDLKKSFDDCDLVYKSFAQQANPNIGLLAAQTIGIDRRFYNSNIRLFQYVSDSISKYWIEYELIAPKEM